MTDSGIPALFEAKQVMELLGSSQSTFGDMISELGISTSMASDAEYTFLAPLNDVFTGESHAPFYDMLPLFSIQEECLNMNGKSLPFLSRLIFQADFMAHTQIFFSYYSQ